MWFSVNLGLICFKNCNVLKNSILKSSLIPISCCGIPRTQVLFKSYDNKNLGHSTILWQDGSDMQELPVIVRKIRGAEVFMLYDIDGKSSGGKHPKQDSPPTSSGSAEHMRKPQYSMGEHTFKVSMDLFELNRDRLVKELKKDGKCPENSVIVMKGGSGVSLYDTDIEYLFRQEGYFHWAFGVEEPDFYAAIEVNTGKSHLFAPRLPAEYSVWMGPLLSLEDFKNRYKVNETHFVDELSSVLKSMNPSVLLVLAGENSDSKLKFANIPDFEGMESFNIDNEILFPVMAELRVVKTDMEIDVLRYICRISSEAHRMVMTKVRPDMYEYQAEAIFLQYVYFVGGSRHTAYTCICGSGPNSGVLHYGHAAAPNRKQIKDGDMLLFDMGASYYGYASDITCSFPANGKFTEDQKLIYNAVLASNRAVQKAAKPGVSWVDMHKLANEVLLTKLIEMKLLKGNVTEMMEANMGGIFQPHGLGHLIGIEVHDVGGYLPGTPERPTQPGLSSLRTARILQKGMYMTIEPGCYFIDIKLDSALADPKLKDFFNVEVLERFRGFGGVRIEDDVLITEDGCENFTEVPRTIVLNSLTVTAKRLH
ncbi:unnamed protein product [Bemisia tabaci]|uniref:Xaa-Pro dipeptidase n=1 Tax=Bemisia tabaci TaxID=7038 RepID=A0A9P0F8D4_BEMTA|nr:unnamed protein product [Bemisia tabaci]